jgi:hypothetical protein
MGPSVSICGGWFVDVIARQHLLLIQPAPDAAPLQRIMQPPRKEFVLMRIADETGVVLKRLLVSQVPSDLLASITSDIGH